MDGQDTHLFSLYMGLWLLLHSGWAAKTDPVYVALNDPVLLNIPDYPNAEKLQVTWRDGNGVLMGKFKTSSAYDQTKGCECELFRNGSLYLNRLGTVGNKTYKVEVFEQSGKAKTTAFLLVTVIERVRSPILNYTCAGKKINLRCDLPEGSTPTRMELSWNNKLIKESDKSQSLQATETVKSGKLICSARNQVSQTNQSEEIDCPKDTPGLDLYIMIAIAGGVVTFLIFVITLIYFVRRRCCHQESRNGEEEASICYERQPHIQQRQLPTPPTQHDTQMLTRPPADIPDHNLGPKIPPHGPQAQNCPPTQSKRAAHSKQRGAKFPDQASQNQKLQTPSQPQRPPVPANHPCGQPPHPQPREKSKPPRKHQRRQ
ncbi:T-cell surface antigen CD2-like [Xenopus laevis]|uniref:T-cell surface antigen CD2-like n=1 Tax=Xenopus laevis TaxID=8355 RepID=A0A8J1M6K7_XENLA|nr:T-cell surface antigen CD2-like [Xenopus laevis]